MEELIRNIPKLSLGRRGCQSHDGGLEGYWLLWKEAYHKPDLTLVSVELIFITVLSVQ